MASYSTPTIPFVVQLTGVNALIHGQDDALIDDQIEERLESAEMEVRTMVTDTVMDSTSLTSVQVRALQEAVGWVVAALIGSRFLLELVTGTHAPHVVAAPSDVRDMISTFRDNAKVIAKAVATGFGTEQAGSPGYFAEETPERTFTREMQW